MTAPTILCRGISQEVWLAGVSLTDVLATRRSGSTQEGFARATFATINEHGDYDDAVEIKVGVTAQWRNGVSETPLGLLTRFTGYRRDPRYDLFPQAVLYDCIGELGKAAEYVNIEDPNTYGGLRIDDLVGHAVPAAAGEIVKAVLTRAGVSYDPADIHDSGALYASGLMLHPEQVYLWAAGTTTDPKNFLGIEDPGEKALSYIQKYDAVDAQVTHRDISGTADSGGFYRTIEADRVKRILMGGRPRDVADWVASADLNVLEGSSVRRERPTANRVVVKGFDYGKGPGPVFYAAEGTNPYMSTFITVSGPSSPFIERDTIESAGDGMTCQECAEVTLLGTNRITPKSQIRTPDDALLTIGQTHLVAGTYDSGTGDTTPARTGTNEKLWCQSHELRCDLLPNGAPELEQTVEHDGGGTPDATLPDVGA